MNAQTPQRLVIFTDAGHGYHLVLVEALLRAAAARRDAQVVGLCDTNPRPPRSHAAYLTGRILMRMFNRGGGSRIPRAARSGLRGLARKYKIPLLTPPGRNVNDPAFVETLRVDVKPDLAISVFCSQIFKPALIGQFQAMANFHDGLLPAYRGIAATSWSLYQGERVTGYTWHRVTEAVDEGPILLQDAIPVHPNARLADVFAGKINRACRDAEALLDLLVRRAPGTPQGEGSQFNLADLRRIRSVENPLALSYEEWHRRLRAFSYLRMNLKGQPYLVTRVHSIDPSRRGRHRPRFAFATCDGVLVAPTRFFHLPLPLYRVARWLNALPASARANRP